MQERVENEMDFVRIFNFEYKKVKQLRMCFRHLPNVPARLDLADNLASLHSLTVMLFPDHDKDEHISLPYIFNTGCPFFAVEIHARKAN